jgi:hypothetical protein
MNSAASIFVKITRVLEDMHGIAIEGHEPDIATNEGCALLAALRVGKERVAVLMADAALTLG